MEDVFLSKIPESFIELLSVRSLCSLDPKCSLLYLSSLNKRSAMLILKSFIGHSPPFLLARPLFENQFDWMNHCLMKTLNLSDLSEEETKMINIDDFYVSVLKRVKAVYAQNLVKFIEDSRNNKQIEKEGDEHKLFLSIFMLFSEIQPLFYALRVFFPKKCKFSKNESKLIQKFGNTIFEVSPEISIQELNMSNYDELSQLFQQPNIFLETEISCEIQNNFFRHYLFPEVSFFGGSSLLGSLFNSSAVLMQHFVDLSMRPTIEFLNHSNFDEAFKTLSLFPDLQNYAVLAVLHTKMNDINWISLIVNSIKTNSTKKKVNVSNETKAQLISPDEIFNRIKNDLFVVNEIQNWTGQLTTLVDLQRKSMPFILKMFLTSNQNEEPFRSFNTRRLLNISDKDWGNDNDFVSAFFAILYTVKLVETNDDSFFEFIENHLSRIGNRIILNAVSIDMFSILFLTINDSYFTLKSIAERLLTILISMNDDEDDTNNLNLSYYLRETVKKIQYAGVLFPDKDSVESVLRSSTEIFALSLEKKEFEITNSLDFIKLIGIETGKSNIKQNINDKFSFLAQKAKQINKFEKQKIEYNSLSDDAKLELLSSFNVDDFENKYDTFISSYRSKNNNELVLSFLLNKLKEHKNTINYNLSSSSSLSNEDKSYSICILGVNDFSKEEKINFEKLNKKLIRLSATKWENTKKINNKSNTLDNFFSYLDELFPALLMTKNCETLVDCLSYEPQNIIAEFVKMNEIEVAKKISKLMKIDFYESLLKNSSSISNECAAVLSTENPILSVFYSVNDLENNHNCSYCFIKYKKYINEKTSNNSNIVNNYQTKNFDFERDLNKILDVENNNFNKESGNNIYDSFFTEIILKLIQMKPIKIDILSDILWKYSEEKFIEMVLFIKGNNNNGLLIENLDLNDLMIVCERCFFINVYEMIIILKDISNKYHISPFPLNNSFSLLLKEKNYLLAKRFCNSFKYKFNPLNVLRKEILNIVKEGKNVDDELLKIEPSFENELIQSIPTKYHIEGITADFFEKIPKTWIKEQTPNETILSNFLNKFEQLYSFDNKPCINNNIFKEEDDDDKEKSKNVLICLFNDYEFLNIDKDIMNLINSKVTISDYPIIRKISFMISAFKELFFVVRNLNEAFQTSIQSLISFISMLSVCDPHSEHFSFTTLKKIRSALLVIYKIINIEYENQNENNFQGDFSSKNKHLRIKRKKALSQKTLDSLEQCMSYTSSLLSFVGHFPCSKYGDFNIIYSFGNLTQPSTGDTILGYCFSFDFVETANAISKAWNISISASKDMYCINMIKIGIMIYNPNNLDSENVQQKLVTDRRHKKSQRTISIVREYINCFSHVPFIDPRITTKFIDQHKEDIMSLNQIDQEFFNEFDPNFNSEYKEHSSFLKQPATIFKKLFASKSFQSNSENSLSTIDKDKSDRWTLIEGPFFFQRLQNLYKKIIKLNKSEEMAKSKTENNEIDETKKDTKKENTKGTKKEKKNDNKENETLKSNEDECKVENMKTKIDNLLINSSHSLSAKLQLNYYLKNKSPIFENIHFYISIGRFEKALSLFTEIGNENKDHTEKTKSNHVNKHQEKWNIFLENMFIPSLAYNCFNQMLLLIKEMKIINHFGSLFEKILAISKKSDLNNLRYEILMVLERYDEATITAVNLFKKATTQKLKIKYLDLAYDAALDDLNIQKDIINLSENENDHISNNENNIYNNNNENPQDSKYDLIIENDENEEIHKNNESDESDGINEEEEIGKKDKYSNKSVKLNFVDSNLSHYNKLPSKNVQNNHHRVYSKEVIFEYVKVIPLQRQFCEFCAFSNLNLFSGKKNCEQMVVYLLKNELFRLVVDIIVQTGLSIKNVSIILVDILTNEEDETIESVCKGFEKIAPQFMFKIFVSEMMMRSAFVLNDERLLLLFLKIIEDKRLKCSLQVQFNKLEEAFSTAKEGKLLEFLPMIANLACKEGKLQLMADAINALTRMMKKL